MYSTTELLLTFCVKYEFCFLNATHSKVKSVCACVPTLKVRVKGLPSYTLPDCILIPHHLSPMIRELVFTPITLSDPRKTIDAAEENRPCTLQMLQSFIGSGSVLGWSLILWRWCQRGRC